MRTLIGRDVFPLGHRKKGRVGRVLSFIALLVEDLIFFALVGCAIAVLIYCSNDGVFRILIPFGVAVGFFTYYFTAGRLVIGTARRIARAVCIAVTYGAILLRLPVLMMIGSIKKRTRKRKKQGENNNVI